MIFFPAISERPTCQSLIDYVYNGTLSLVENPEDADCILVGGGDGFMLETMRKYCDLGKPFLGINCGTRGFLLNLLNGHPLETLELSMFQHINVQKVAVRITYADEAVQHGFFFNDIVLGGNILDYYSFEVATQDRSSSIKGTGLVVNTPLGSTGYSLNLGQPMLPLSSQMRGMSGIATAPFRYTFLHKQSITIVTSGRTGLMIGMDGYNDQHTSVRTVEITPTEESVTILFFDDLLFEEKRLLLALEKAGKGIV